MKNTRKHLSPEEVGRKLGFRSGLEKAIATQFRACGIDPKYESLKLKYRVEKEHTYTPVIRGLLCNNCNKGLGMFKENTEAIRNAAKYLEGFKCQEQ